PYTSATRSPRCASSPRTSVSGAAGVRTGETLMATLEEIGQLGGPEKEAARDYADRPLAQRLRLAAPVHDLVNSRKRMAFLQGIAWERARMAARNRPHGA